MLGEFVDDYTVRVIDVFAMPQSGTGVSVEAVDPVFQAKMLDMLKQTGRPEMVVGWYHSHPGFGCWLSGVDINTQQSFEALTERTVVSFCFLFSILKEYYFEFRLLLLIQYKV
jgi:26S proteasome regulatory subunit N11